MPEEGCAFYRSFEPSRCAEIAKVRLWPINDVLIENTDAVPGCDVQPLGYVAFATTIYGDAFCFDTGARENGSPSKVVLISHELDWEGKTRAEVFPLAKPVADSFEQFLERFVAETLDIEPLYPELDL
jgi:SMI1/KNR4 family protein SUKH-1